MELPLAQIQSTREAVETAKVALAASLGLDDRNPMLRLGAARTDVSGSSAAA